MTTSRADAPLYKRLHEPRFAPLTKQDQDRISAELAQAVADGDERRRRRLRDELVERHLRLVVSISAGYAHKLDREEGFAVGVVALTEAMERWSPAPGGMSAYQWARRWVTTALNKAADASRQIRIPEQVAYKAALATKAVKETEAILGRPLDPAEIEELTGGHPRLEDLPLADISLADRLHPNAVETFELTVADVIADNGPTIEERAELNDQVAQIREALEVLTSDERRVLEHRFGLNGAPGKTLAELGVLLGTSGEAVRRLEASALAKLNHPANQKGLER